MEQSFVLAVSVVLLTSLMFMVYNEGFKRGQSSVRIIGQRHETLKISEALTVERTIPEGDVEAASLSTEPHRAPSLQPGMPHQWRDYVNNLGKGGAE